MTKLKRQFFDRKQSSVKAECRRGVEDTDGYVVVEAAVLLPFASILILLLIYLCSYLYQGCYMMQAAYVAAFRGSRYPQKEEAYVQQQLDELLGKAALSFGTEKREVKVNLLSVQVSLKKDTPFSGLTNAVPGLAVTQKAAIRDAVSYIRGIRRIKESYDKYG